MLISVQFDAAIDEASSDHNGDGWWPFRSFVEQLILDMFDPDASLFLEAKGIDYSSKMKIEREIDLNMQVSLDESEPNLKKPKLEDESFPVMAAGQHGGFDVAVKIEDATWTLPSGQFNGQHDISSMKIETEFCHDDLVYQSKEAVEVEEQKSYYEDKGAFANSDDCAIRFLCVLSLDRFGEQVSDREVAPVQETCAQAFGAAFKYMHPSLVHETLNVLLQMQRRPEWEIRHGSLLGIQYLVAVRQNNIMDLWSLFDFLMPGFLGTERQFQATYGKPLVAARDPKCSAKDAEAGALAMEALHKQFMEFLWAEQMSLLLCLGQYLLKLCSHPLLVVVGEKVPESLTLQLSELFPASSDIVSELHKLHHSPKLVALREILEECGIGVDTSASDGAVTVGQYRVLIFAQHKYYPQLRKKEIVVLHSSQHSWTCFSGFMMWQQLDLYELISFLASHHCIGLTYLRLDGSVEPEKHFDIVKAFNSDPTIDALLLTTHVGGLGLNLTSADTLVFMEHDWNPMRDHQAMDRAHSLKTMNTDQLLDLFASAETSKKGATASKRSESSIDGDPKLMGTGKGLKAILCGLEELRDQSQYTEEYNLSQFLAKLNG
ncbi:hypothetical protein REPUB_Repub06bG0075600 [Reevesia pubescens]